MIESNNISTASLTPVALDQNRTQKIKGDLDQSKLDKRVDVDTEKRTKEKSEAKDISLTKAKELAETGNTILENTQRNLQFKVDNDTNQVVMSIIDKASGEVIRQLPTEEALELVKRMQKADGDLGVIIEGRA